MALVKVIFFCAAVLAAVSATAIERPPVPEIVAPLVSVAEAEISKISTNNYNDIQGRIVGGVNTRRGEFPHICSIQAHLPILPPTHVGAGNILNSRWLLTVASVVQPPPLFGHYEILCGRTNLGLPFEITEQRVRVNTIFRHPLSNPNVPSANDVALIQTAGQLFFTDMVAPITLPVAGSTPAGIASLLGWGGTDEAWIGQSFGFLQMSRVAILAANICTGHLSQWNVTTVSNICTGPVTGGLSPCNVDRGSSLLQVVANNNVVIGLISLPQACGQPGFAGTYVRVSAFNEWITQTMF